MIQRVGLLIITMLLVIGSARAQGVWEHRKSSDDIHAYTRQVESSKFDEFKVIAEFEGTIPAVLAVLKDFEIYPILFDGTKKVVNHVDESHLFINHVFIDTPFPAKDRDAVYKNELTYHPDKRMLKIEVECIDEYYVPRKKYIQMSSCQGQWLIEQINVNTIRLTHQFLMDPGGNVPAFIVNMQTVKNPIKTVKAIKSLVNNEKYRLAEYAILKQG